MPERVPREIAVAAAEDRQSVAQQLAQRPGYPVRTLLLLHLLAHVEVTGSPHAVVALRGVYAELTRSRPTL